MTTCARPTPKTARFAVLVPAFVARYSSDSHPYAVDFYRVLADDGSVLPGPN